MSRKSLEKIADGIFRDAVTAIGSAHVNRELAATARRLVDLLSEAAVEIDNLDSPDNPVVARIRLAIAQLTMGDVTK